MFYKSKNKWRSQSALLIATAFVVACSEGALTQKLDGEQTQANLGLKVQSAASNTTAIVEAGNMTVTAGQACIEEIRLKLPDGLTCDAVGFVKQANVRCEVEDEQEDGAVKTEYKIIVEGPFTFDLLTGSSTPSLADVAIPSGVYREIEFRFDAVCGLGEETTLTLDGSIKDTSNVDHPFSMALEYDDDLEIESPTDVQVLEGQANGIFANLILNQWFANVDLAGCIEDGDLVANGGGVVVINKDVNATGACEEVYDDILDGIKDALEFEDSDHDDDGIDDSQDDADDDHGGHGSDD